MRVTSSSFGSRATGCFRGAAMGKCKIAPFALPVEGLPHPGGRPCRESGRFLVNEGRTWCQPPCHHHLTRGANDPEFQLSSPCDRHGVTCVGGGRLLRGDAGYWTNNARPDSSTGPA